MSGDLLDMLKRNLSDMEEGVLNRNIGRFNRWIAYLDKSYTAFLAQQGRTINNEIATWVSNPEYNKSELNGMSFLQIAVVSGSPDMVKRVLEVCVNPTMPTAFDIEYRKQSSPYKHNETQEFDGKTARGIADKILEHKALPPEYKTNYQLIRDILLEIGAQGKYPKYKAVMESIQKTGQRAKDVASGVADGVGTVLKAYISAGGKRKHRKTMRNKRKQQRRKTRNS